jgi:hypothetical protein
VSPSSPSTSRLLVVPHTCYGYLQHPLSQFSCGLGNTGDKSARPPHKPQGHTTGGTPVIHMVTECLTSYTLQRSSIAVQSDTILMEQATEGHSHWNQHRPC